MCFEIFRLQGKILLMTMVKEKNVQCANTAWLCFFPIALLHNLDREWSDHAPIKLILKSGCRVKEERRNPLGSSKLEVDHEGCEKVIHEAWVGSGHEFEALISHCVVKLREWSEKEFGVVFRNSKKKRIRLAKVNLGALSASQMRERKKLIREIAELTHHEEIYWSQRSRNPWLFVVTKIQAFFTKKLRIGNQKTP